MRIVGRPFGIFALAVLAVADGLWALAGVAGLHERPGVARQLRGAAEPFRRAARPPGAPAT